jgi:hypothetical protein
MISLDLGGNETKIVISEVLNPHAPKILLLTDQSPIGQMIFMGSIKVIPKEMGHLGIDHVNCPFGKLD